MNCYMMNCYFNPNERMPSYILKYAIKSACSKTDQLLFRKILLLLWIGTSSTNPYDLFGNNKI